MPLYIIILNIKHLTLNINMKSNSSETCSPHHLPLRGVCPWIHVCLERDSQHGFRLIMRLAETSKSTGLGKWMGAGKWPGRPRCFQGLNLPEENYRTDETDGGSPVGIWKPGREDSKFSVLPCISALKPKLSFNKTVSSLLQERKSGYYTPSQLS